MKNDATLTYMLPGVGQLLGHGSGPALLLRDGDVPNDIEDLHAFIRSGDYFALLATRLDAISDNLHSRNEAEAVILQHIVNNLIYLDRFYKLVKKTSPGRNRNK